VVLRSAEPDDRELLRQLVADYLFEFDGRTAPYSYFDAYWTEPERLPFLIEVDGVVAGFCLIRVLDGGWHIAEFSVLPEKRRDGVGRAAVDEIVERARDAGAGYLEAKVLASNRRGLDFWLAVGFEIVSEPEPIVTRRSL
jgi:ribosomal protein S18 acetylase RimI-like enzyme